MFWYGKLNFDAAFSLNLDGGVDWLMFKGIGISLQTIITITLSLSDNTFVGKLIPVLFRQQFQFVALEIRS